MLHIRSKPALNAIKWIMEPNNERTLAYATSGRNQNLKELSYYSIRMFAVCRTTAVSVSFIV